MTTPRRPAAPPGLGPRGKRLWKDVTEADTLDGARLVILQEACRCADRLDRLDKLLNGDVDTWAILTHRLQTGDYELKIDSALSEARQQQNTMKQLLASLRLPDAAGNRPQARGGARGAYGKPVGVPASPEPAATDDDTGTGGTVTPLERARRAAGGSAGR